MKLNTEGETLSLNCIQRITHNSTTFVRFFRFDGTLPVNALLSSRLSQKELCVMITRN